MSHRTQDLEQKTGLARIVREMRYNEVARQSLAVVLILLFALTTSGTRAALIVTGMAAALVGMLIRLFASGIIMKNKELAQTGPYAMVRHPLYTGNILLVTGFAIANQSLWALPLSLLFFWFYYPPAIEYEDRKLESIFGQDWRNWAGVTPALLPKLSRARHLFSGQWSFAKSTRKNGEILIVAFVLVCAYLVVAPLIGP